MPDDRSDNARGDTPLRVAETAAARRAPATPRTDRARDHDGQPSGPPISEATPRRDGPCLRILMGEWIALGPGKVRLLDAIDATGSISGAARELGMSYRRAWNLVDAMNRCFAAPLVDTTTGGSAGGGATVTPLGDEARRRYRAMEAKAAAALADDWAAFRTLLKAPDADQVNPGQPDSR